MKFSDFKNLKKGTKLYFNGMEFDYLGWDDGDENIGIPLCTNEDFENLEMGYAHIEPDGRVYRYGQDIGSIENVYIYL